MASSRAQAAYRSSAQAFRSSTLDLLRARYAAFVVAALSLLFTAGCHSYPKVSASQDRSASARASASLSLMKRSSVLVSTSV